MAHTPDERESVADQHAQVLAAIEREGGRSVLGTFGEANQSGYRKERGPQLEAAMALAVEAAAEHGEAELWVFHSSRLARGTGKKGKARALGKLLYDLQERGVTARSATDDLYTTTEEAWGFASRAASKYSEDLAAHTTRGIHKRQREGKAFGCIPHGYAVKRSVVDNEVRAERVIDPMAAQTVEAVWSMIEAGERWGPIARELNARGLRTNRGNPWTPPVVRDLAKSRLYLGEKGYPAMIEPERWERIQDLISASTPTGRRKRAGGRPLVHADAFLLRSLAFCLKCGQPMHIRSDKSGHYVCRARKRGTGLCDARPIPAPIADERVLIHLETFIGSVEDWIAERLADRNDERARHEAALACEQAALGEMERLRGKLLAEYERQVADDRPTAYLALEAVARKDRELREQVSRIEAAEALVAEWEGTPDVDAALRFYNDLVDAIRGRVSGAQSVTEVNAALSTIVAGIWLGYDGKRLDASFALRPLDGRSDVGGLAQVLAAQEPGKRWPLHPPTDDYDPIEDARADLTPVGNRDPQGGNPVGNRDPLVDQPATRGRRSRARVVQATLRTRAWRPLLPSGSRAWW